MPTPKYSMQILSQNRMAGIIQQLFIFRKEFYLNVPQNVPKKLRINKATMPEHNC